MYDIVRTRELLAELKATNVIERIQEWIAHEAAKSKKFNCPFCEKRVTIYHRPIHKEMGQFLMKLYAKDRVFPRFYTMRELDPTATKAASDGSYLVHWGLVERSGKKGQVPLNAYQLTDKGRTFIAGQTTVPSHCHMLNNKVVGWSDRHIHIKEIVEDYEDLLYR